MINQVNKSLLYTHIKELTSIGPHPLGSKNSEKAADYIFNEFKKIGLETYRQQFRQRIYKDQNIIATQKGKNLDSDAIFIICAHYDTTPKSPGANDDSSGIAAMINIAHIFSQYDFNHTIRYIAFSGEEYGFLGAQSYAKKAYEDGDNIVAVFNLDVIGCAFTEKGGKTVQLFVPDRATWISEYIENISKEYYEYTNLDTKPLANHPLDHDPFKKYGYDSLSIIQYDPFKNIHTSEDTIDNINFTYLIKTTKLVLATTASIAQKPIDLQVQIINPFEGYVYFYNQSILKLPYIKFNYARFGLTYIFGRCNVQIKVTTNEEIDRVYYTIDGDHILYNQSNYNKLEWRIQGYMTKLFGRHTLGVYVYTKSGKIGYDEMDIYILTLSRLFW